MKKKLAAAALSLVLLTGCNPARQPVLPLSEEPQSSGPEIAYVPLDDRPDNVERVVYLAESLGYRLAMPEISDYRTALDGQPKNYDSLQCGNPWSLLTWVLDQEAAGCDRYILSLDQLHSGGLVSSRCVTDDEIPIPGGGTTSSSGLLDHLLSTLAEDPDNTVWLLDSVMRLAPTVGYEGGTLEDYNALRAYGAAERPALSLSEPDAEDVCALYHLGCDGQTLHAAEFGLTEEQVSAYLTARSRKLSLSERVLHTVQRGGYEQFRVLIGIDDSSEAESIQKNEIAYLRSQLREGDALLSGVDDLAFKAVAKLYLEETGWSGADVSVEYFGGTELQPACAYDYQPLKTIVAEHLAFFGLTETRPEAAQLRVLVLTQPADAAQKDTYIHALVSQLKGGAAQIPTILIDAGNGTYGTAFHEALTKETELGRLLSYAGCLDMAIVTGTALSHGVARYAFLHTGAQTDATERAFLRTLADSILKDFCYKHVVREDLLAYIRQELGGDPNNFWLPEIDRNAVLTRLEQGMENSTRSVLNNLEHSRWIASLPPAAEWSLRDWPSLELTGYRFPWDRAFEIGMDILMSPLEPVS